MKYIEPKATKSPVDLPELILTRTQKPILQLIRQPDSVPKSSEPPAPPAPPGFEYGQYVGAGDKNANTA